MARVADVPFRQATDIIAGPPETITTTTGQTVGFWVEDLQGLENVERGMAQRAIDDICGSGGGTVLSTLAQKGGAFRGWGAVCLGTNPGAIA